MTSATETTPWGEPWRDLANAVISDPSAPPFLQLAAVRARLGDESELRILVADAVALNEREKEQTSFAGSPSDQVGQ